MLTLRRKENESIQLGDNVVIKVLQTTSGDVLLGIEAPREIPVHRSEVTARMRAEGKALPVIGILEPVQS